MRSFRAAVLSLLLAAVAGCGGGAAASITPPPDAAATLTAHSVAFDRASLSLPATPAKLFFKNLDGFETHNVAIYTDESAATPLFVGKSITNAAMTYVIPALPPGTYFFRCDIHPVKMRGVITVGGGVSGVP